ncbi:MAG: curli-like amyloid fiber formation chaperone CsgH [Roseinatronobacter sp.]
MSVKSYSIAALILTGAACTASLATSRGESAARPTPVPVTTATLPLAQGSAPIACAVRVSERARQVTIAAEATARRAIHGTYRLTIDQRGGAGRATILQQGEFVLKPGERATLGEASLSGRARDFVAELEVTSGGQVQSCRSVSL